MAGGEFFGRAEVHDDEDPVVGQPLGSASAVMGSAVTRGSTLMVFDSAASGWGFAGEDASCARVTGSPSSVAVMERQRSEVTEVFIGQGVGMGK
jgi:hypothetical protein